MCDYASFRPPRSEQELRQAGIELEQKKKRESEEFEFIENYMK